MICEWYIMVDGWWFMVDNLLLMVYVWWFMVNS